MSVAQVLSQHWVRELAQVCKIGARVWDPANEEEDRWHHFQVLVVSSYCVRAHRLGVQG